MTFHPAQSFYPEEKIVIYFVGLTRLFPGGEEHEQSLEFFGPKIPQITSISPENGEEHVPTNKRISRGYLPG